MNNIYIFGKCRLVSKTKKRKVGVERFASCMSLPGKMFVGGESKRRRVYQPAEGGPATGFLRSGNSPRLT